MPVASTKTKRTPDCYKYMFLYEDCLEAPCSPADCVTWKPFYYNVPKEKLVNLAWGRYMDAGIYRMEHEDDVKAALGEMQTEDIVQVIYYLEKRITGKYHLEKLPDDKI